MSMRYSDESNEAVRIRVSKGGIWDSCKGMDQGYIYIYVGATKDFGVLGVWKADDKYDLEVRWNFWKVVEARLPEPISKLSC